MYESVLPEYMSAHPMHACCPWRPEGWGLDALELELQLVVSHHMVLRTERGSITPALDS